VARETNATYSPSELITGLELGPFPADSPSAEIEMSCGTESVAPVPEHVVELEAMQIGRQ
jgi:hypothetical protein